MSATEAKGRGDDVAVLPITGARSRVEVVGIHGIFYKVRQGGEVLVRRRGGWPIAMKNGKEAKLTSAGWLPGFQSLYLGKDRVYRFGEGVPVIAKIVAFLPLVLIGIHPVFGGVLGFVLVLYNITAIKNPALPTWAKFILPLFNTAAGIVVTLIALGG